MNRNFKKVCPPRSVIIPEQVTSSPVQEIIKEKGFKGCSFITDARNKALLYVCVKDGSSEPSFFYYDRSQPKNKRIKQVEHISGGSDSKYPRTVTIEFEGGSKPLHYAPPQWRRYWKGKKIKPEAACKVTRNSSTSFNSLTCNQENNSVSSSQTWQQEIPAIL